MWTKHGGNPIFKPKKDSWDKVIEDFVVIKKGKKYYAFYCGGGNYNFLSGIGVAISDNPLGPFMRHGTKPLIEGEYLRLGSIIKVGEKWRMYFSKRRGNVFLAESENLTDWDEMPNPVARNVIQPCVCKFGKEFLLMATDMKKRGIVAMWSDDGMGFSREKKILTMKPNTGYAFGLGNPNFITERNKIHIFFEGRPIEFTIYRNHKLSPWRIFKAIWNGKDDAKIVNNPVLELRNGEWDEARIANPNISKFGNKHYIYYNGWGEKSEFEVGVAWRNI